MTKRRHERISRHAAVIVASSLGQTKSEPLRPANAGPGDDRAHGLRRWRGEDAERPVNIDGHLRGDGVR
jgi:hypothetical protein